MYIYNIYIYIHIYTYKYMYIHTKTAHLLSRIKGYLTNSAQREGLTLMLCLSYAYACVKHIWHKHTHSTAQQSTYYCNLLLFAGIYC